MGPWLRRIASSLSINNPPPQHEKTLLVVDDEPTIQLILRRYFEADFIVVPQPNGQEAMRWLDDGNTADAIVADY